MGCYGYGRQTTPYLDELAKKGILFNQAIAQSNWTIPSLPSIMTSTYPYTHKVYTIKDNLDSSIQTLAEIF